MRAVRRATAALVLLSALLVATTVTSGAESAPEAASAAPTLAGASPAVGPGDGGYPVLLTGSGFTGATAVDFGTQPAASFSVLDDAHVLATAPPSPSEVADLVVDVVVTTPDGASSPVPFRWDATPERAFLPYARGTTLADTEISLALSSDQKAAATTAVTVDGAPLPFTVDGRSVRFTMPAHPAGPVTIIANGTWGAGLTTPSATEAMTFTYLDPDLTTPPSIHSTSPSAEDAAVAQVLWAPVPAGTGGDVTVIGQWFSTVTDATVEGVGSVPFTVVNDSRMVLHVPPAAVDTTARILLTSPSGTNAYFTPRQVWFVPPATVEGVNPTAAPAGSYVIVRGTGFRAVTDVRFDGIPATSWEWLGIGGDGLGRFRVIAPPHVSGPVQVTVASYGGTGAPASATFTYTTGVVPTITGLSRASVPHSLSPGIPVTITGTGFTADAQVSFGGEAARAVTYVSATELVATTPWGPTGTVDVVVTTPGGSSPTGPATKLTFYDPPTPTIASVTPNRGPFDQPIDVVVTGTGFLDSHLELGNLTSGATNVVVVSDTEIHATVQNPWTFPHMDRIRVVNSEGSSTPFDGPQGLFAFQATAPYLAPYFGLDTRVGPVTGGTEVAIFGQGFDDATQVWFGDVPATSFEVIDYRHIRAVAPPAAGPGRVEVRVESPEGLSQTGDRGRFYYR